MALNAAEVRIGADAQSRIYRGQAPGVLPIPDLPTDALDAGYINLGYASDEGLVESNSDSSSNIVGWQGAQVVRTAITESVTTFAFTLIQTRGSVLEAYHRGSHMEEPAPGEWRLDVLPVRSDPRAWIFDVLDGDKLIRIVLPNAEVTERGDSNYQSGEAVGYPFTITAYPGDGGFAMRKLSTDVAWGEDIEEGS